MDSYYAVMHLKVLHQMRLQNTLIIYPEELSQILLHETMYEIFHSCTDNMKEFHLTEVLLSEFYRYMPNIYLFLHYG